MVLAAPEALIGWSAIALGSAPVLWQRLRHRHPHWRVRPPPESRYRIDWDHAGVCTRHPEREDESVLWKDVVRVSLIAAQRSPRRPTHFILLQDRAGLGATFPIGAPGTEELLAHLVSIPGFHRERYEQGLTATFEEVHSCWVGDGVPAWGAGPLGEVPPR